MARTCRSDEHVDRRPTRRRPVSISGRRSRWAARTRSMESSETRAPLESNGGAVAVDPSRRPGSDVGRDVARGGCHGGRRPSLVWGGGGLSQSTGQECAERGRREAQGGGGLSQSAVQGRAERGRREARVFPGLGTADGRGGGDGGSGRREARVFPGLGTADGRGGGDGGSEGSRRGPSFGARRGPVRGLGSVPSLQAAAQWVADAPRAAGRCVAAAAVAAA